VEQNEAMWLMQARKGNDDAFAELVERYQRPVFNLCYRMLGNEAEAEDAAQETFWRAYQSLHRYDDTRSFITWLLSIAAHYCIDQIRKRRMPQLSISLLPDEAAPDPLPGPEMSATRREEETLLHALLEKLAPQDRAAIILRYWHEMSEDEIAASLGLTVSAVKSRLHRARRVLAEMWQKQQQPAGSFERRTHEISAV